MLFRSDRKSTRLNSSHTIISYAVFCLKKKSKTERLVIHEESVLKAAVPSVSRFKGYEDFVVQDLVLRPFFFLMIRGPPRSTLFPSTPLFRPDRKAHAELHSHDNLVCRLLLVPFD